MQSVDTKMTFENTRDVKPDSGFTLIELAVIMIILGIFMYTMAHLFKVETLVSGYRMNQIVDRIQYGIAEYVRVRGVYPCPADPSIQMGDPDYGISDCTLTAIGGPDGDIMIGAVPFEHLNEAMGCAPIDDDGDGIYYEGWAENTVNAIQYNLNSATQIVTDHFVTGGVTTDDTNILRSLPDRSKCIPGEYIMDVHGTKFTYAVSVDSTNLATMVNSPDAGAISVIDENGFDASADPVHYVLVSHGRDDKGGFSKYGQAIPCGTGASFDDENCDGDTTFRTMPYADMKFATDANHFDDRVEFSLYGYMREDTVWRYSQQTASTNNIYFSDNSAVTIGVRGSGVEPNDRVRVGGNILGDENVNATQDVQAINNVQALSTGPGVGNVDAGVAVVSPKFCYDPPVTAACQ